MIEADAIAVVLNGQRVLDSVSLSLADGEMLGVVGPNGSGKTTLLRALYGAAAPARGTVRVDGTSLARLGRREVSRRIAVVPQGQPVDGDLTVGDLVGLGRIPHHVLFSTRRRDDETAVAAAIARVGLARHVLTPLRRLSGGEVQRAVIARALCQGAPHLLLDEPTNHLDPRYQHEILEFLAGLGLATLIVLHDLNLAARYCDRIALMDAGRILAVGPPADMLEPGRIAAVYRLPASRIRSPAGRPHLIFADSGATEGPELT